jgi:glycosyltransferase involved in cell wall biosynthesis
MILADERDVQFQYALPEPYFGPAPSALLEGLKQCPEIELHIISCVRQSVRVPERLAENTFFHTVQVSRWAYLRTAYLPCILKIRKKLRTVRPDIVHGQGTERYQGLAAAYSGFPSIITIHGNIRQIVKQFGGSPFFFHWLSARLEPLAIRKTAGILCLSRYAQEQVQALARRTWLLPNAVAGAFFNVMPAPAREPTLLCIANVDRRKNQNALIRALDPIALSSGLRLVFLGRLSQTTEYGAEFVSLVSERPWCSYAGFKAGDDLRAQLRAGHMLVLPTLEDNCPMVVIEAMAAGLPVAASRVGGIPDLIAQDVNGLLFDPNDGEAIRTAVLRLLRDPAAAQALAVRAKNHASERYTPIEIARRHIAIYAEVTSPGHSS